MTANPGESFEEKDDFYTLVPEQGLCLIGDTIINLRKVTLIRKQEGKTLVYSPGVADPIILPSPMFERIRDAVFAVDDFDDDDEEDIDDE